jgi:hypothetical protein
MKKSTYKRLLLVTSGAADWELQRLRDFASQTTRPHEYDEPCPFSVEVCIVFQLPVPIVLYLKKREYNFNNKFPNSQMLSQLTRADTMRK